MISQRIGIMESAFIVHLGGTLAALIFLASVREVTSAAGHRPTQRHHRRAAGVWVETSPLIYDKPRVARTDVTVILPREGRSGMIIPCRGSFRSTAAAR